MITRLNEYFASRTLSDIELMEMANASEKYTGIKNTVLWFGPSPPNHGYRIKVSNTKNKFDGKDCFTISIPDYKIIGTVNKSVIDNKKIEEIIRFTKLNEKLIMSFSNYEIETGDFLNRLIKI